MTITPTRTAASLPAVSGARLQLRGLTKKYGDKHAIRDVHLDVEPGEIVTLLGPSGSGKTTTLNAISGFTDVDAGSIVMDGRDISGVPSRSRGIGMVFQNYALFPHMTVRQNISFPLDQRRVPRRERDARVDRAIATVRLEGMGDRKPAQLSGGQQQRVALARAIVFEPGLLLMDEPLGALDRGLRESMQAEIRRIHREVGSTVVLVTHDQEEALGLSDRIALFDGGGIRQVGTGEELYSRPDSLFVATFLGESTVLPLSRSQSGRALFGDAVVPLPEGPRAQEVWSTHEDLVLVVRPESARLAGPDDSPAPGHASLPAVVVDDIFLGATRRTSVMLGDGSTHGIVRDSQAWGERAESGTPVQFAWPATEALLLPRT